jgi:hypothetical protein
MPKRPRDLNALAKRIVDEATDDAEPDEPTKAKNPAAVELGRKGGKARAAKTSAKARSESARRAARSRWDRA